MGRVSAAEAYSKVVHVLQSRALKLVRLSFTLNDKKYMLRICILPCVLLTATA